ncbi:type I restriction enzyme HsdR N-terminal domain-containing protein [Rhodocytophaga rosea]|uniref:Type I restriction enzyme HsdR N-terminal domain-containing protein n=1 Tax=Rhodocytophaga rosea TaxID=2704465 RepID=A0A6C0GKL5_9BACT|nr:type I restriction enzyme HsdR N-terminal domain-containing protein [Rhodocytophaga rosea]QHT68509.1 type I restriction enzyme HsdR N-terminal domain-containing protein [Rhodocytophaga rosea]
MIALNLPPYEHKIKKKDDKLFIFDILRKKYVFLTPEEWVRQHFVHFLINKYHYPKALMKAEGGLKYNNLPKRTDLVIFDSVGKPLIVVECKDVYVPITQAVFEQAARYNYILKAPYLIVVNGLSYHCCRIDHASQSYQFLEDIPMYISPVLS